MAFFHSFTDSLKQKWLQFFQINRDWITLHMEVESVYTPDGGKRPPSYLILGVANALEPKLAQLMLPFSRLNPDADTLIEVLDLNFDPDIALGNRIIPRVETQTSGEDLASDEETSNHSHLNGFAVAAVDLDTDGETLMVVNTTIEDVKRADEVQEVLNGFGYDSFHNNEDNELNSTSAADVVDDFGDISFDELKGEDSTNFEKATESTTNGNGEFSEVLSDIWGDESAANKDKEDTDNDMFLGEDLSSSDLDDSEIASLFPNN
ncbi:MULTISPECIES: DUF5331 domain-containing protein [Nostocales]|uniref:DUF5331 domain-containing protein n=3 Tax=Nostocales TaxID=1161 RepID=A0A0C1R417_9CYAN|nr:DUF5331 domain-containing protein [Tolypothrix bouteillei]KAF3890381.1 DUF5331 domain-containing protein [Tolypothrix bouteillei VB521301]